LNLNYNNINDNKKTTQMSGFFILNMFLIF
jgi:hypothetical protein